MPLRGWRKAPLLPVKAALMLLLVSCGLAGCGYHFAGSDGMSTSIRGKTIAVPVFGNKTYRPNLETIMAGSLRDEIAWRSGGKAATSENADLVLTGTVLDYSTAAVSYNADDRIREYRAAMTVEAVLRDRIKGEVLWKGTRTLTQDYPMVDFPLNNRPVSQRVAPSNRIALQQNSEDAAVRDICRKMAQDIYEKITDGF